MKNWAMPEDNRTPGWFWPAALCCAAALLIVELIFLPLPGLQQDEVLFVRPFLHGNTPSLMLMDYVGALKSWLYWPIFRLWSPGVWSVRLPVCLVSATTLLVLATLVLRVAGPVAAILASLLLASDASFILTNVFDWGPVALLLLASVAILALGQRFVVWGKVVSGQVAWLAAASLIAGLSLWNKAAFIFPLAGMTIAGLVCYPRNLRKIPGREFLIAAASFIAGVSPLLFFNVGSSGATIAAASHLETAPAAEKLLMLQRTLDGRDLEHYMFRSAPDEKLELRGASLPVLVEGWYKDSRLGPGSGLLPALLLSLLALPFLRRSTLSRPLTFAWLALLVSALFMFLLRDAGSGPHHTVLLYPAPHFIVAATAVAIAELRPRLASLAIGAVLLIVASNTWLIRNYYVTARNNGFSVFWTDALPDLAKTVRLKGMPAAFLDWGIEDNLRVESGDAIHLADAATPAEGVLYVSHCPAYVLDEDRGHRFDLAARTAKLVRVNPESIRDREGTPIFCLFSLGGIPRPFPASLKLLPRIPQKHFRGERFRQISGARAERGAFRMGLSRISGDEQNR